MYAIQFSIPILILVFLIYLYNIFILLNVYLQINIDNISSDFFTLIEVFATDKVGLLYLITKTLFDLHLDIRIAKIGNKGDQSADIFYVTDFEGQRIEDNTRISEIKNALLHQLDKN